MTKYKLHFRERVDGQLYDRFRVIEAQNKLAAKAYAKSLERENYWFMGIVRLIKDDVS